MAHQQTCKSYHLLIDVAIKMHDTKPFVTQQLLAAVYMLAQPCEQCRVKDDALSSMTGNLYLPIWQEHVEREMTFLKSGGRTIDIFPQS